MAGTLASSARAAFTRASGWTLTDRGLYRTLRRLTVDDGENADRVFEMLMGNDVAPRKQFIVQGAYSFEADRIDA